MKSIHFATSNKGKFKEAQKMFKKAKLGLKQFDVELMEIQSEDVEFIARMSCEQVYDILKKPVFVEDAGLFVNALKGFPGPYSKHAFFTIEPKGIVKLLEGAKDRSAYFQAVIAYKDEHKEKVFKGICRGSITHKPRGRGGFGFDPIFLPENRKKTFAEDVATKAGLSHRAMALKQLIEWLKSNG